MYYNTGSTFPPTEDTDPGYMSVQRPSQPAAVTDTTYTSLTDTTPADTQGTTQLDHDYDYIHPI